MQIPLQISFENAEPSEAVRAAIGHEVERLEKYQHRITGCRVAVVAPSTKHRHGAVYRINIWVTIPPHENIVVSWHNARAARSSSIFENRKTVDEP
jgi:ribosome-associated translation inhibitor RaiA